MSEKVEYVPVTIKVPRKLLTFLEAMAKQGIIESLQNYLEYSIIEAVQADINTDDVFHPSFEQLIKRYDLGETFKATTAGVSKRI
jgi:hypothetical protein